MAIKKKTSSDVSAGISGAALSRHWWVNYAAGEQAQVQGSYLWLPKNNNNSSRNQSQQNMTRVAPGDIVFACTAGAIDALGFVLDRARGAPEPAPADAGAPAAAAGDGWLLPVRFVELARPQRPQQHLAELKPLLPSRQSPLRANGAVNRNVYLAEVAAPLAAALRRLLQPQVEECEARVGAETDGRLAQKAIEEHIWRRADIGPNERRQLIGARVGQGVFRERLERIETACRVTGILDRRYLQATHIKPWKDADDGEKLDGANGLLLSPHMRLLFERGHISFADDGALLVSRHLNPYVRTAWDLEQRAPARVFIAAQRAYLEHHRRLVFEKLSAGRRSVSDSESGQPEI